MSKVQDLKQLDGIIERYLNFKMDDSTIKSVIRNVFQTYPLTENMRDNLNIELFEKNKMQFKRCLIIEYEEISKKMINIGDEGFLALTIYTKLASLITKILNSQRFNELN